MPMNINVRQLCSLMCTGLFWSVKTRQSVGIKTGCTDDTTHIIPTIHILSSNGSFLLSPVILSRHLFFFALCLCVVSSSLLWQIRSAVTCCLRLCCHWSDLPNFPARMLLSNPSRLCLVTAACSSQMFLREIFVSLQPLMWFVWLNNKAEWFNSISVWSSQFCLHNQDSTMRIFPLVQSQLYFRFLLALPTFHWPHHTFF